jgi:hypothetical protein
MEDGSEAVNSRPVSPEELLCPARGSNRIGRPPDFVGALDRTRPPAAGCDQQRLPKAIGPDSASVRGTVAF